MTLKDSPVRVIKVEILGAALARVAPPVVEELRLENEHVAVVVLRHSQGFVTLYVWTEEYIRVDGVNVLTGSLVHGVVDRLLKGHCLIFLSAIYQLFIEYFNIK